ncbi:MAG: dynamin, partial [Cyanobacteria bacterium P01_A01_bin.17]
NLLNQYQDSATLALQENKFESWVTQSFRPAWMHHQKAVVSPIHKACEFFEQPRPADLWVSFPTAPSGEPTQTAAPSSSTPGKDVTPVAIATGVGLLLSGPVGAAVLGGASYLLNKKESSGDTQTPASKTGQEEEQIRNYLTQFSQVAFAALQQYQSAAQPILQEAAILEKKHINKSQDHQLQLLQATLAQLQQSS